MTDNDHSFHIGRYRFDVTVEEDMLMIYCNDASIAVIPHSSNVVKIKPEPHWSRKDKIRIVEHYAGIGTTRATKAVDALRGMLTK